MKTVYMWIMILAAGLALGACTSTQLGTLAKAGALAAGKDEATASKIGTATQSSVEGLLPVPVEQEKAIGGGVAIKAFQNFGPMYDDTEIERYVNLVGKAVAANCSRPDLPYAFAVIDNDTPNAFAGPGGYVFITVGALRNMHSEAQLAAVLAHECAHISHRHAIKTLQRAKLLEGASQWASVADPANGESYGQLISAAEDALFNKGLDQKMEYQADQSGVEIAAATGYNPWGLKEYLSTLEALLSTSAPTGGWFQTHPPIRERIKRLDVELNTKYAEYKTLPSVKDRFQKTVIARLKAKGRL